MFGSRQVRRALLVLSVLSVASCEHGPSVTAPPPAPGAPSFSTSAFTGTGSAVNGRFAHVAMRLSDGRVLVAGGISGISGLKTAELYDPTTGTWSVTGSMAWERIGLAAAPLPDGRVLVAGGARFNQACADPPAGNSTEIYDPATGAWTLTGSMHDPRMWAFDDMSAANFMTLLPDGRVLAAGGLNRCNNSGCDIAFLQSAEIYDPASGVWTATGSLAAGRWRHQMMLLSDGRVLVAGGRQSNAVLGSAEIYDPATGVFNPAGTLVTARQDFTATLLTNGSVLLAAGQGITGILKSAELFTPNHAPSADVAPSVAAANEGSAVNFDGRGSSDPDGDALTYAWDFGDGAVGSGATVSHTYADNGSYAVVLTVSDGNATSTARARADIANVAPAVADLGTTTLLRGETFARDGSFADPGADSWTATVDYGDGSGAQPLALVGMTFHLSHVYAAAGAYTATVTVTDDDAGVGTAQAHVTVADHAPVANAGPAARGNEGSAVSFDGALISTATTTAEIANVAPVVSDIASDAIFKNATFARSGTFVDPGADTWTATVDYGDGSGVQSLALSG